MTEKSITLILTSQEVDFVGNCVGSLSYLTVARANMLHLLGKIQTQANMPLPANEEKPATKVSEPGVIQ